MLTAMTAGEALRQLVLPQPKKLPPWEDSASIPPDDVPCLWSSYSRTFRLQCTRLSRNV